MNSKIKIFDNFLDEKDFQKLVSDDPAWNLQTSNFPRVKGELTFLSYDKTSDEFFNTYLFGKVAEILDRGYYNLLKVYFNGQWNGREGALHSDNCDITALIYMSPYQYGWGGFTEIMTEPEPTLVYPIPNRLIIFPGKIRHKAYSFAYQDCTLRVTLSFKINQE